MLGNNIITVQEGGKNAESIADVNTMWWNHSADVSGPLSKGNNIERELSFLLHIMSSASQRSQEYTWV